MAHFKERLRIKSWEWGRRVAELFFGPSERCVEYSFVLSNLPKKKNCKVLEIGGSCSSLSYNLAKSGMDVSLVDVRSYPYVNDNLHVFQDDIMTIDLPKDFFDCIILVSVIEHIGMGAYGDPLLTDGDFFVMNRLKEALKKDGNLFLTTHFVSKYHEKKDVRYYDESRLNRLTSGYSLKKEEYYVANKKFRTFPLNWTKTTKQEALETYPKSTAQYANVCLMLGKK